jgi:hypothetical protein
MAHITYHGGNGHNPEIEREKVESLKLANAIQRAKLEKLKGDVIDRREVEFVISSALVTLRTKILQLPKLIAADLQGRLEHAQLHAIKLRVEGQVDRALNELADDLEKSVNPKAFLDELTGEDTAEDEQAKDALIRKKTAAKAKRTAKRNAKRKQH